MTPTKSERALSEARSLLFVPGNRPERFMKALASGADAVVLDLEDSVPPGDKQTARAAIRDAWLELNAAGLPLVVRINALEGLAGNEDLDWLAALGPGSALAALMVPKAESRASLERLAMRLPGAALVPIIETAAGHAALAEIAAAAGVLRLAVGHIDFMADTGLQCSADEVELAPLRFAVAMATRLHRLAPAIDGITVDIADEGRVRDDTRRALRYGFGGKLCIHPRQIAGVHAAMAPSAEELTWARRVTAADERSGGAAVQLDGRMVDAPVVLQARRVLARVRAPETP
jgi:citrate lyase subunit beta/citryl-CoA lyase